MGITYLNRPEPDDTFKQVRLALWHPGCWTLGVTDDYDDTHLIEKSLYTATDVIKGDFILVTNGPAAVETVIEAIDGYDVVDDVTVLDRTEDRARVVVVYERESSIVPEIVNSSVMPIEPVHITGGQEFWTMLTRTPVLAEVVDEMEDACDVQIRSIRAVGPEERIAFADVVDRIQDDLTPRQRELTFEAREAGYYDWPRNASANDVAERTDISAATLLEHLRRGEQKILHSVFEELERRHPRS